MKRMGITASKYNKLDLAKNGSCSGIVLDLVSLFVHHLRDLWLHIILNCLVTFQNVIAEESFM